MQIIQSLLGTQVNPLGQKSYLGFHHQHNNFIQHLVTSKPLFTPSRLFLNRKRQLFIDTLIREHYSDNDYLGNLDMDSDFPEMELANYDLITPEIIIPEIIIPENNTNSITDTNNKFNLGNISHLLQTQIANNNLSDLSDDILPEIPIQPPTKTTRKTQKQKTQKKTSSVKTQPKKTTPKKTTKSSTTKKVKQVKLKQMIDEGVNHPPTAEENLNSLITDNPQSEILNLTDNYPVIQQQTNSENFANLASSENVENFANLDNNIIDSNASNINSSNLDNNSTLSEEIADDEPPLITDLPSNLITDFHESDIIETGEISIQARKQDRETDTINDSIINNSINSDSSESSTSEPLEPQTSNIEGQINIVNNVNNFTNHQPMIVSETPENVDNLDINVLDIDVSANSLQRQVENENITQLNIVRESDRDTRNINDVYPALIDNITTENLLSSSNNSDDNILDDNRENLSNSLAPNEKLEIDRNSSHENIDLGETQSLISDVHSNINSDVKLDVITENISTKSENVENSFIDFINTQETVIVSDVISPENQDESVNQVTISENTKKPVDTSEAISSLPEIQLNYSEENNQIQSENQTLKITDVTTEYNTEITPVTSKTISPEIELNSSEENNQIQSENQTSKITDVTTEITPVTPSPILPEIQLNSSEENNQIQSENQTSKITDVTTEENTEITPVTPKTISAKSEEVYTPDDTPDAAIIKPENSNISLPKITDNLQILRNKIDNEQITASESISESILAFETLDLSTFINHSDISDISENSTPQDNEDKNSHIDIEANTVLNNVPALPALPAPKGYATGGQVTTTAVENHQPVAPSDTVPAMLTPGEFVINAQDAQKNLHILKHINTGGSPEEIIAPKFDVTHSETPEQTNFLDSTTKVDSLEDNTLQRKEAVQEELTALNSPSLGVEIGKQRLSRMKSLQINTPINPQINPVENTTNTYTESTPNYSSPALIFRKHNSTTNTQTPSEWTSIEELLNSSNNQFNNYNFNSVESNWQNTPSSQVASSEPSQASNIFTKRLSTPQGFANGGEVTSPDISRAIAPVTETIQNTYTSLPTKENESNENNKDDNAKLEALAQEIYYRLRQRIEIERERQGKYIGRLPW